MNANESTVDEVNQAIELVASKKDEWAKLPVAQKVTLLERCLALLGNEVEPWVRTACEQHGYEYDNPEHAHLRGETYMKGPAMFAGFLWSVLFLYQNLAKERKPPAPLKVVQRGNGQLAVKVFPWGNLESALAGGGEGYVYVSPDHKQVTQTDPTTKPAGLCGVLGAGNFDAPTDILDALFMDNKVVVFKPNPVNGATAKHSIKVLAPLVEAGYVRYIYGAVNPGKTLTTSPKVDELLMTGSCMTYDAIVWGPGNKNKAGAQKLVTKPFRAELGSVNPYIIVPGVWSDKELEAHAQQLAAVKWFNNAHICASPQVVVTAKNWPQREKFLKRVRELLAEHPGGRPYYPNWDKSFNEQKQKLEEDKQRDAGDLVVKQKKQLFDTQPGVLFATGVSQDAFALQKEAFCPVLVEHPIDGPATAAEFVPRAVKLANDRVWGSLTCTLIVDPKTEAANLAVIDKAIDDLQFGAIGINQWAGINVSFPAVTWGAFPRHTPEDVRSGIGKMGNTFCVDGVEKGVIRMPFVNPGLLKVPSDKQAMLKQAQRFCEFQNRHSTWSFVKLLVNALTGL